MKKYLEYFEGAFDSTVDEKRQPEKWPYVAYSESEGVVYTVIPQPIPETWKIYYTSRDEDIIIPYSSTSFGANILDNIYKDGQGILIFDGEVTEIGERAFFDCSSLTSITIPNNVTVLRNSAFANCSSLESVFIPNGVRSIQDGTFSSCTNLTSVSIPDSVTSIGYGAFSHCSNLSSVTLSNSVTSIDYNAFWGCSSLVFITIPTSVKYIGNEAFSNTNLRYITYKGTQSEWSAVKKGSDWNSGIPATYVRCTDGNATI
jgi:hypothetical protein